jgi:hypothetical protein
LDVASPGLGGQHPAEAGGGGSETWSTQRSARGLVKPADGLNTAAGERGWGHYVDSHCMFRAAAKMVCKQRSAAEGRRPVDHRFYSAILCMPFFTSNLMAEIVLASR